jgi:hypothetical protein
LWPVHWSLDGKEWLALPGGDLNVRFEVPSKARVAIGVKRDAEEMYVAGLYEPIAHSLLREAWEQRFENPRSALITGMAALEVGVKHCISGLEPATAWLVENLPAPPVVQMLREQVPRLPAKNLIGGKVMRPSEGMLGRLREAAGRRNRIAHFSGQALDPYEVTEILKDVADVLWLMDYYQGQSWALDYIRPETRAGLA